MIKNANELALKITKMSSEDIDCLKNNGQDKEDLRKLMQELVKLAAIVDIRLPNKIK